MLEMGSVREKNVSNIAMKNMLDTCISAIAYYLLGFGLQVEMNGGIIGTTHFLTIGFDSARYLQWFFFFSQVSTSTTIVSGSLAE